MDGPAAPLCPDGYLAVPFFVLQTRIVPVGGKYLPAAVSD